MKHTVHKKSGKFRVVESTTRKIARNKSGVARDGGGHKTFTSAAIQASILSRVTGKK